MSGLTCNEQPHYFEGQLTERLLEKIVIRNSRITIGRVSANHTLAGDLGFDSMAFLMLFTDLQETIGLDLPMEMIDDLKNLSFGGLVGLVSSHLDRHGDGILAPQG